MKDFSLQDIRSRPEVIRQKTRLGMLYGLTTGLSFAVATWGWDGYLLSQAHAMYPWLKLIVGVVICAIVGGLAGWLVARLDKGILAPILYLGVAIVFAWLVVFLPLRVFPQIVSWLDPETGGMLNYIVHENFDSRFSLALIWIALFVTLAGILQLPLSEPAAFATSFFSRISPLLICSVIMVLNAGIIDSVTNEPLRSPIIQVDQAIQFSLEHRGQEVDRAVARAMHLTSLRAVQDVLEQPRRLIVGTFDEWLGQVNVLTQFGNTWVDCAVIYNQPSFCSYVSREP
jgi:hypothetical protein